MRIKHKVIKMKGVLIQGELRRSMATIKSLRENVTIMERRVIWRKCAGERKGSWRVMLLPLEMGC